MTWTFDIQSAITVGGVIAQAAITWWRVLSCEKDIATNRRDLDHLEIEVKGLREFRAEMKQWLRDHGGLKP